MRFDHFSRSVRFLVRKEMIYGINNMDQLWAYNLHSGVFNILAKVSPDIDYLTDISDSELLATVVAAEKKEVIELSVKQ